MGRAVRLVVVGVAVVAAWYLLVPSVAGHFGYATRWPSRMPSVLGFNGRDYHGPTGCLPRTKTPFGLHRPYRVGTMPVLLGDDAPIFTVHRWRSTDVAPVILRVKRSDDCYVVYSLEGGP